MSRPAVVPLPRLLLAVVTTLLAACSPSDRPPPASADPGGTVEDPAAVPSRFVIRGALTYLPRIALPDDAVAEVVVRDAAASGEPVVAEQRIALEGRQVPVPFEVAFEPDPAGENRYVLTGSISQGGRTVWVTEPVSLAATLAPADLGELRMSSVQEGGADGAATDGLAGPEWVVEDLDGRGLVDDSRLTLTFGEDGRVTGLGGCNSYGGGYVATGGGELEIGQVVSTLRACAEALMDQEARFHQLLAGVRRYRIDGTGALVLTAPDGGSILARRE